MGFEAGSDFDRAKSRSFAIVESAPPAGAPGPPRHIHDEFDQAWYVLEGEIEFSIGDQAELCGAGSLAFAPRGLRTDSTTQGHTTRGCWSS